MIPYWILTLLFIIPFVDPRRPFRLVHLDVLVLVFFGLYFLRYMDQGRGAGSLQIAVVLANVGLTYLLGRTLLLGFRQRKREHALLPIVPAWLLGVAAVLLIVVRVAFPLVDDRRPVIDVGLSSVLGAERILAGQDLYGAEGYKHPELRPDTYGPVTYVLYAPFALALSEPNYAARAAAGVFDLLTGVGLFLLGRNLREGAEGSRLGFVLAYAWASFPYAFFVTAWAYNDTVVALFLVAAMLAIASPLRRGLAVGFGTAAKFAPAVIVPLFARGADAWSRRAILIYALALTAAITVAFAPFIPDGGLPEVYERMIGWQIGRQSDTSIWGQYPSVERLRPFARAAVIVFAVALAFVPRRRTPIQVAALATAAILAFELSLGNWLPSYVVWFAPAAFVAFFAGGSQRTREIRPSHPRLSVGPSESGDEGRGARGCDRRDRWEANCERGS